MTTRQTRWLAALSAALAAGACAAAAAEPSWDEVYPLKDRKTFTVANEGVSVQVTPPAPYPDDREVSDEEFDASYADATISVTFPGLPAYAVPKDEYRSSPYGIRVGVGRLSPDDPAPSVLLAGYSGGAHCCATLQVVSLVDGKPASTVLPMKDGEPLGEFPGDIDGDGAIDFEWIDSSLLYAFTSYAGSWAVPRFYNVRRGELVDVSRQLGFVKRYREFGADALKECRAGGAENAGACAAYAYAMAVQGKAEEGIRTAVQFAGEPNWYPIDCLVEYDENDLCPEGKERRFHGFEDALRWLMRQHGYLS